MDMDEKYNGSPEADGKVEDESSDVENWDNYPEIPPEEEYKFDITEDVVVVEEKKSGIRYAALRVMKNKLALLARGRKKRDKTWVPIWWHRDKSPQDELTQITRPGAKWRLYLVQEDEAWQAVHTFGKNTLNERGEATHRMDKKILNMTRRK